MLQFTLSGKLLDLVTKISQVAHVDTKKVLEAALLFGAVQLDGLGKKVRTVFENADRTFDANDVYIIGHWMEQTDEELASALNLSTYSVFRRRCKLGLHHKRGPKRIESNQASYRSLHDEDLTLEDKEYIRTHLQDKNRNIAVVIKKRTGLIISFRRELARKLIKAEYAKPVGEQRLDVELGKEVGLPKNDISHLRLYELNLKRIRWYDSESKKINHEDLKHQVTVAGLTVPEYIRMKGIKLTRSRVGQICEQIGISPVNDFRTVDWYANRYKQPILKEPERVKALLEGQGAISTVAAQLGLGIGGFIGYLKKAGINHEVYRRGRSALITLTCSNPNCPKPERKFEKVKSHHDAHLRKDPQRKTWYCSRACHGSVLGRRRGNRLP
jgi:hypothetical protein